jgi:predicted ATP-grasp superfamily ATP-dependent carboligase
VAREAETHDVDLVVPIGDITTFLLTAHRDRLGGRAIPCPPYEVVERAANKVDTVRAAERLGVPTPRTVIVDAPACLPGNLSFPIVVKPWKSRVHTPGGWMSTSVSYAADADELRCDLTARSSHEFPILLQERIFGPGIGVFACYQEGRPVALFSHRRLRERPPWGGVSVVSESTPMCDRARDYAIRLLDDLRWHGVAMVEFKRDVRDDLPKLMEINGRFWGSLQLAIDAGVNFPALLVDRTPARLESQAPYRVGVRNRWLWGDVDSLLLTLFPRAGTSGVPLASRVAAMIAFMKFWGADLYYENPKWSDIRPWLLETYRWFETGARGVGQRIGL